MKARDKQIYAELDRFINNYKKGYQIKYIRLKANDYQLLVDSLSHFQQLIVNKKGISTIVILPSYRRNRCVVSMSSAIILGRM